MLYDVYVIGQSSYYVKLLSALSKLSRDCISKKNCSNSSLVIRCYLYEAFHGRKYFCQLTKKFSLKEKCNYGRFQYCTQAEKTLNKDKKKLVRLYLRCRSIKIFRNFYRISHVRAVIRRAVLQYYCLD